MIDKEQAEAALKYLRRKCADDAETLGQALGLLPYDAKVSRPDRRTVTMTREPAVMEGARSIEFARGKVV